MRSNASRWALVGSASPAVAPHWALVSTPPCAGLSGTLGHGELASRRDPMCCYVLHGGPPLHRHDRPPASYGMLCSKSQLLAGRRQVGAVQVAYRIWLRWRSSIPGSWPLAPKRWSQSWVVIGSSATRRSRRPPVAVRSRQVPYPPGGPGRPAAVKANPGPSPASPGGSRPSGGPGFCRLSRGLCWFLGSGRAQPCPMACPSWSVTVTHQVVWGWPAAAPARSRAWAGSIGPMPPIPAGPAGQAEQGGQRDGQVDPPGKSGRQRARGRSAGRGPGRLVRARGPGPPPSCPPPPSSRPPLVSWPPLAS